MAVKKRPGMMLYFEDLESLYRLDDAQLGVLVRAMAAYAQAGENAALEDPMVDMAFSMLRFKLDHDRERYEAVSQSRATAARRSHAQQAEQVHQAGYAPRAEQVHQAVYAQQAEQTQQAGYAQQAEEMQPAEQMQQVQQAQQMQQVQQVQQMQQVQHMQPTSTSTSTSTTSSTSASALSSASASTGNARARRFTPPTVEEVMDYADSMGYGGFDAHRFVDYYAANGWQVGRSPMRDWQASVRNWRRRDEEKGVSAHAERREPTDEELFAGLSPEDIALLEQYAADGYHNG